MAISYHDHPSGASNVLRLYGDPHASKNVFRIFPNSRIVRRRLTLQRRQDRPGKYWVFSRLGHLWKQARLGAAGCNQSVRLHTIRGELKSPACCIRSPIAHFRGAMARARSCPPAARRGPACPTGSVSGRGTRVSACLVARSGCCRCRIRCGSVCRPALRRYRR